MRARPDSFAQRHACHRRTHRFVILARKGGKHEVYADDWLRLRSTFIVNVSRFRNREEATNSWKTYDAIHKWCTWAIGESHIAFSSSPPLSEFLVQCGPKVSSIGSRLRSMDSDAPSIEGIARMTGVRLT